MGDFFSQEFNLRPPQEFITEELNPPVTRDGQTFTHMKSIKGPPPVRMATYEGDNRQIGHMEPLEVGPGGELRVPPNYDEHLERHGSNNRCVSAALLYQMQQNNKLGEDATTDSINEGMGAAVRHPGSRAAALLDDPRALRVATENRGCYGKKPTLEAKRIQN